MSLSTIIYLIKYLNVKTLYFNFKSFPFSNAIRFPIFLSKNVVLKDISGKILLSNQWHSGAIKIGFGDVGIFDKTRSKTIWEVKGQVIFDGIANIGHGTKICVGNEGILRFGDHFNITAESSIICFNKISFGANCLLSWEILIMDTDFHKVYQYNECLNADDSIEIANKVWIGARCTILKGTYIAEGSVVAAGSIVNKPFIQAKCILAGVPAKIINENIEWTL